MLQPTRAAKSLRHVDALTTIAAQIADSAFEIGLLRDNWIIDVSFSLCESCGQKV